MTVLLDEAWDACPLPSTPDHSHQLWAIKGNNFSCQNTAAQPVCFLGKMSSNCWYSCVMCSSTQKHLLTLNLLVGFSEPMWQGNNIMLPANEWSPCSNGKPGQSLKFKTVCFSKKSIFFKSEQIMQSTSLLVEIVHEINFCIKSGKYVLLHNLI